MKILKLVSGTVTGRPVLTIGAVLIVTMIMMGIIMFRPIPEMEGEDAWIPDHETVDAIDKVDARFSQSRNVPILVHAERPTVRPNLLTSDSFVAMVEIESALMNDTAISRNVTDDGGIISLPRILAPFATSEDLNSTELMDLYRGMSDSDIQGLYNNSLNVPKLGDLVKALVTKNSGNGRAPATIMLVCLDSGVRENETSDDRYDRVIKLEEKVDDIVSSEKTDVRPVVISEARFNEEFEKAEEETGTTLLPLAFGLIVIILWITFRTVSDLVISLIALVATLVWVMGFQSLLGYANSPLIGMVSILLIGLGVDYSIHLTMRYREKLVMGRGVSRSANIAIVSAGAALLLAAFTDMVGFLSNGTSNIGPVREFGIIVALGILSAYVVFVTFVPSCRVLVDNWRLRTGRPLLSKTNVRRAKGNNRQNRISAGFDKVMSLGSTLSLKRPKTTLSGVFVITLIMLALSTQVSTTFNFTDFLSQDSEFTDEVHYLQDEFDFSEEQVIIYVEGEDVAKPEVMQAVAETQRNMENDDPDIILLQGGNGLSSPLTIMQDLANGSDADEGGLYDSEFGILFSDSDEDGDNVPDRNISMLFDYVNENHPDALSEVLYRNEAGKYTSLLIIVKTDTKGASRADDITEALEADAVPLEKLESNGVVDNVVVTGAPVIMNLVLSSINESMVTSIMITVVVSGIVLTFVFWYTHRSWTLGALTVVPVIMVLIWIQGTMYLLDIPLNMVTLIIGSVSIGLGVTYAIHVTHRFMEEMEEHGRIGRASRNTVTHTGTALFGAAVTTMVGFGMMGLSSQVPMQNFGILTALTILYSFLVSVFIQPSMLVLWARVAADMDVRTGVAKKTLTSRHIVVRAITGFCCFKRSR